MNLSHKTTRKFAIEEHPLMACIFYLTASFFAQFLIPNAFYAMCMVDLILYIYVFIRRTLHPISRSPHTKKAIWLALFTVIILLVTTYLWSRWYMSTIADNNSLSYVQRMSNTDIYIYLFMIGIAAPLGEESLFRYIVLNGFMHIFGKLRAPMQYAFSILFSSLLFAIMHGTGVHLFVGFFCGLALSVIYLATNRLGIAIAIHALYNIGTLFLYVPLSLNLCVIFTLLSFLLLCLTIYYFCHRQQTSISG